MAAYAALASLSQTIDLTINQNKSLFPVHAEEKIRSILEYVTVLLSFQWRQKKKCSFSMDTEEIIISINEYVIFLLSFLEEFPEKAKRWEGKMRDVAHKTEDIIEQFMWQQSYNRWTNQSSVNFEDQLGDVMEKLCSMAGDIMEERHAHSHLSVSSSSSSSSSSASSRVAEVEVVGLEDDLLAIKDRLCGLPSKLQIIPIVGMGGVGKTTLARSLYDDPLIMGHFDIRAWLTISQDYSEIVMISVLLNTMNLLVNKSSSEEMKLEVYQHLKGRRYLIVMDDVWSTKVWDDVRNIFPDDDNGSRIMLTTRLSDLAAYPDSNSPHHEMRLMNASQCWDMLKRKVFANSNCPPELVHVGKEIARNCVGLPLVVVLVAGSMSVSKTRSSWNEISKNVKPVVGEEVEGILSFSYMHLPHYLRPCFLYMGLYAEDEEICASTLIRLWVAEGFLKHQNGGSKSLEEEAEEYLEDLVKRNLVIVTRRKSNGKINRFSLHDMVREMCIRKARDEKFFRVIDHGVVPQGMINERRISLRHSDLDKVWGPTIHTILCLHKEYLSLSAASSEQIRLVRILDAVGDESKKLPSQVIKLFHLRYLALTSPSNIPSSISNLTHLQTLFFRPANKPSYLEKKYGLAPKNVSPLSLPSEIWRMSQLRHLILSSSYTLPNPPHGSTRPLENLQTLWGVANLVCSERILKLIPNTKKLQITYHKNKLQIFANYKLHNLVHLRKLQVLEVTIPIKDCSWRRQNPRFPCTLRKLSLSGTRLPWKDMAVVGALPYLEVLNLRQFAYNGDTWETNDGEFLQLKFLLIEDSNLKHWITETSHFPRLQSLVLHHCHFLSRIPEDVGDIPTLELIEVDDWKESLVDSAKQIHQDQLENYGNDTLRVRCVSSLPDRLLLLEKIRTHARVIRNAILFQEASESK